MKVVIVDDEPLARMAIRVLVEEDRDLTIAGECSGPDAPALIARERPDILFLDVQMPEVDGFEVLERVGLHTVPAVVFVTAYESYAVRAFEVNALDYLVKPFDDTRFFSTLARAKQHAKVRQRHASHYLVRLREKVLFIRTEEIDWIEAADYYVSLHVGRQSHLLRKPLAEVEAELDPRRFVRVHRSAIVNVDRIREMRPVFRGHSILVLQDGTEVRISRARRLELEKRMASDRDLAGR